MTYSFLIYCEEFDEFSIIEVMPHAYMNIHFHGFQIAAPWVFIGEL
jgi:hypothetical protein